MTRWIENLQSSFSDHLCYCLCKCTSCIQREFNNFILSYGTVLVKCTGKEMYIHINKHFFLSNWGMGVNLFKIHCMTFSKN